MKMTGHPVVDKIGTLNFEGHQVPHTWYKHLTYENKRGTYTHHLAILMLADIVYWYRPSLVKDEQTGEIIGWRKKFKADKLQRSYSAFCKQLGCTDKQAREAAHFLQKLGLIDLEPRNVKTPEGLTIANVMFIGCNPDAIANITFSRKDEEGGYLRNGGHPPLNLGGTSEMGDTSPRNEVDRLPDFGEYTKITNTKISTQISLSPLNPLKGTSGQERERGKSSNLRKKKKLTKEEEVQEVVPTQFNIEPQSTNTPSSSNSTLAQKIKSSAGACDNSSPWDWIPQGEWKLPETGKLDSKFVDWEIDKWQKGSKYDRATIFKLVLREWKKEPALLAIAWEAYRMEAQHRVAATMVIVQAQGKMEECDRAVIDQYLPAATSSSENSPVATSISQNVQSYLSQCQALSTPSLEAFSSTEEVWTEQEKQENLEKIKKMREEAIAKAKQNSSLHTTKRAERQ